MDEDSVVKQAAVSWIGWSDEIDALKHRMSGHSADVYAPLGDRERASELVDLIEAEIDLLTELEDSSEDPTMVDTARQSKTKLRDNLTTACTMVELVKHSVQ